MTMNDLFVKSLLSVTIAAFALGAQAQHDEPAAVVTDMVVTASARDRVKLREEKHYGEPAAVVADMVVLASAQDRVRALEEQQNDEGVSEEGGELAQSRKHVASTSIPVQ